MACFLVPMTEAIITTIAQKVIEKKEKNAGEKTVTSVDGFTMEKTPFSKKLGWLNKMLWGGSALLAFEHVWHGEVVPYFPFLTAAGEGPEAVSEMLHEMGTAGVCMALIVTVVWIGMLLGSKLLEKRALKALPAAK
ncbi:MAG: hypothetical protein II049_05365 [Clostridia bacterium]|nr:hypothetical protein [Clostridia bacterium]